MTTSGGRPLSQWTEDQINASLEANAPHIVFSMNDLATELERRESARRNRLILRLGIASTIAAAVAAIAAMVAALATLAKP